MGPDRQRQQEGHPTAGRQERQSEVKDVGSKATPEVIATWVEVYRLFQQAEGERKERLQQVAGRLGVSYKVARRRLRNYEAMQRGGKK